MDHCRFVGQNHSGCTVTVWLDGKPTHHRIDHNHLADRPADPDDGNGFETMRLGTSKQGDTKAFVTVENNLFERCDGEIEIISNKSCDNVFRGNTFRACAGTLTLRHGHRATIANNVFLGEGKKGSGGVRIIGEGHQITGNYIADVDDRASGAFSIAAGIPNTAANGYQQVKDVLIAHNTVLESGRRRPADRLGRGHPQAQPAGRARHPPRNLFVSDGPPLFEGTIGEGLDVAAQPRIRSVELGIEPRDGLVDRKPASRDRANDQICGGPTPPARAPASARATSRRLTAEVTSDRSGTSDRGDPNRCRGHGPENLC